MAPPLATLEEFEIRLGMSLDAVSLDRAEAALRDASSLVRSEAAPEDWLDDQGALETVPEVVHTIVLEVAKRAYDNPFGYTQETIDDYTRRMPVSGGTVFLYAHERRAIRRAAGVSAVGHVRMQALYPPAGGASTVPIANG